MVSLPSGLCPSLALTRPFPLVWYNVSFHILNSVFALFELLSTFIGPLPWLYLPLCLFIIALYTGLAYLTYATQHFYRQFLPLHPALLSSVLIPLLIQSLRLP